MFRPASLALAGLILAPGLARAGDAPMPFTYLDFEASVPHIDLAVCPEPLDGPGRFCRLTTHADQLNVFVFSEEGDQPLIGFRSWPSDLLAGLMD